MTTEVEVCVALGGALRTRLVCVYRDGRHYIPLFVAGAGETTDELRTLTQALTRLEACERALEPFAAMAEVYDAAERKRDKHYSDEGRSPGPAPSDAHRISVMLGECRKARAALGSKP